MRSANAKDYWRTVSKRDYENYINSIDLNNYNGIGNITFSKGLFAICGLNGAGKTTIITAIKDILGIKMTKNDISKLQDASIQGFIQKGNTAIGCENKDSNRGIELGLSEEQILFIDYQQAKNIMDFFIDQDNLEELTEQNEPTSFLTADLSYLIGKDYTDFNVIEIEDIEDLGTIPFFEVNSRGIEYDSRKMGVGEHFLSYVYWCLKRVQKDSIIIIEEPETFIGIESQRHLMDVIARFMADKGVTVLITTHSPFILENIDNSNIRIIGRIGNNVSITNPSSQLTAADILGGTNVIGGTLFVEDNLAQEFLKILLEERASYVLRDYSIMSVGGESEISSCLKFVKSDAIRYKFIGIYDGDMKEKISGEDFNWNYTFLPLDDNIETAMKCILFSDNNLASVCEELKKDLSQVSIYLSKIDGENYHDWFIDLCKYLCLDKKTVLRSITYFWMQNNEEDVNAFISSLEELCY